MKLITLLTLSALTISAITGFAAPINTTIRAVSKDGYSGKKLGFVHFQDTQYGLLITPHLHDLPPGLHGFHIHVKPSCANNGMAAKGHLDPVHQDKHLGPYNPISHLGDLPALFVDQAGKATLPILAPRLKVKMIKKHALMIHKGGDNYSDTPLPLGGGGARFACEVIKDK